MSNGRVQSALIAPLLSAYRSWGSLLAMCVLLIGGARQLAAQCPPLVSSLEGDLGGWAAYNYGTNPGFYASGEFAGQTTGGATGGYMRFSDQGPQAAGLAAPEAYRGDWSALNNLGQVSFFHRVFQPGNVNDRNPYTVIIVGPGGRAVWTSPSSAGPTGWVQLTAPLTSDLWTVTEGSWSALLQNVELLVIAVELYSGVDICGIDEVALSATPGPRIAVPPISRNACPEHITTISIVAAGLAPLAYQWRHQSVPIDTLANPSAATATLMLTNIQSGDAGAYDCVVTNACGSVTSNAATLHVQLGPAGDMNCDSSVSVGDIGGFVLALTDPAAYAATYPACDVYNADVNCDGGVTVGDIGPFVELLTGG